MSFDEENIANLTYGEAYRAIVMAESSNLGRAFETARRVLCVQPHPDDTDVAAGGLVAKLAKRGRDVAYVTMSDGGIGTLDSETYPEKLASIRVSEQEEAVKILGVKKLVWLNYKDLELRPSLETRNRLITIVREFQPHIVLTVDP